jgi:hypothetical protein
LSLSSQSSRSCAGLKIKVLKDKGLEFANSIRPFSAQCLSAIRVCALHIHKLSTTINVRLAACRELSALR